MRLIKKMQTLKEYYNNEENLKAILNGIDDPGHRVWRMELPDGSFRQNKKKINTIHKLRELIFDIQYNYLSVPVEIREKYNIKQMRVKYKEKLSYNKIPVKIYISVAKFMQPERQYGKNIKKSQYLFDDNLMIESELYFDFDDEKDLQIPLQDAKNVIEFMSNHNQYELKKVYYSGTKGFNLIYKDLKPVMISNPLYRLQLTEIRREILLNKLPELKTMNIIHKNICKDQYRVRACPGTIKAKTGHIVAEISKEDIMTLNHNDLLSKYVRRVVRSTKTNDRIDVQQINLRNERSTLISYPYHFVDNKVKGKGGMYVTVLKYPLSKPSLQKVRKAQLMYKLSDFHVYVYGGMIVYMSFKLVDKRRLDKIMKMAKPMNLNSFMYYGHTWVPMKKKEKKWVPGDHIGTIKAPFEVRGAFSYLENNKLCKAFEVG